MNVHRILSTIFGREAKRPIEPPQRTSEITPPTAFITPRKRREIRKTLEDLRRRKEGNRP